MSRTRWRNISWWQLDSRSRRKVLLRVCLPPLFIIIAALIAVFIFGLPFATVAKVGGLLIAAVLVILLLFDDLLLLIVGRFIRPKRDGHDVYNGTALLMGEIGEVRSEGLIFINGALWRAECDEPLTIGDRVEVVGVVGLTLKVKKIVS